jgi:hypothetical protein
MEIIKTPHTIPSNAKNISPQCERSTLWHLSNHSYIFTIPEKDNPVLAFESEMFTELLLTLDSPIFDIEAFRVVYLLCHEQSYRFEIRLELEDGSCFCIEDNDSLSYNCDYDPKVRGYGVFPEDYPV